MTNANPAIHVVHPTTSTHSTAEKNRLMGKPRFHFEPHDVMQRLKQRIIGQEAALDEIEKMLHVVKADFSSPERPLSVTLMLGPTGVGKTETVRLISEVIYGRPDAFCRIDMNTLAQEHYAAAITGAPPGYVGSKEGHSLFDEVAIAGSHTRPGIVLFDELEKASTEVLRGLMNVLDSGKLTLTSGTKTIDFRNCMIFMTSNVGAQAAQQYLDKLNFLPKKYRRFVSNACRSAALLKKSCNVNSTLNSLTVLTVYCNINPFKMMLYLAWSKLSWKNLINAYSIKNAVSNSQMQPKHIFIRTMIFVMAHDI